MAAKCLLIVSVLLLCACGGGNTDSHVVPNGSPRSAETKVLETGARVLQATDPLRGFDMYLNGFHPMRDDAAMQMEAHHYCNQVNEDFAQCVLFDGNTRNARLNGIEYIVSERIFQTLAADEKKLWHPHNYEILSGELMAPGLPAVAERELMKKKINSYGKTWHVWMTDSHGKPGDALPLGEAHLAWSFNHDGELDPAMLRDRDKRMSLDSNKARDERKILVSSAKPQNGVDVLNSR